MYLSSSMNGFDSINKLSLVYIKYNYVSRNKLFVNVDKYITYLLVKLLYI